MRKMIIILAGLLLVTTSCGKQVEDIREMASIPTYENKATNTIKNENTPTIVVTPTHSEDDIVTQLNQLLPEGTYNISTMKRTYVYPSSQEEKREQFLENKFRKGVDLLISKEKDKKIKGTC